MTDQNRKTLRSFYCRDYLWELFEQMTHELGCSMDYLINESMRLYARSRDFPAENAGQGFGGGPPQPPGGGGGNQGSFGSQPSPPQGGGQGQPPQGQSQGQGQRQQPVDRFNVGPKQGGQGQQRGREHRTFERMPSVGPNSRGGGNQGGGGGGFNNSPAPPQPPNGGLAGGPPPPPPRPGQNGGSGNPGSGWNNGQQQQQQQSQPQQRPNGQYQNGGGSQGFGTSGQSRPPLFMHFNNNRYAVDKDKFVIGRGSQQTDLTIRDGNISRKHCAVIFHNGNYYIKDLGSTNGVEYQGNRIESKKIDEGDVFYLCDYELRFSYR